MRIRSQDVRVFTMSSWLIRSAKVAGRYFSIQGRVFFASLLLLSTVAAITTFSDGSTSILSPLSSSILRCGLPRRHLNFAEGNNWRNWARNRENGISPIQIRRENREPKTGEMISNRPSTEIGPKVRAANRELKAQLFATSKPTCFQSFSRPFLVNMASHTLVDPQTAPSGINIGIMTSGGDAQGMNAAIRSVVRRAAVLGASVWAIYEGYQGMVSGGDGMRLLKWDDVSGLLPKVR